MEEIWKDIEGYEGHYQVSSFGRVKSIKLGKEKILKSHLHYRGYELINLSLCGCVKSFLIHRLVCSAFIKKPKNKFQVNHKDGVKTNNHVCNLEWCTQSENQKHAFVIGLQKQATGTKSHNYKGDIHAYKNGKLKYILKGPKDIMEHEFLFQCVYKCASGKRKQHKGFTFKRIKK